MKDLVLKTVDDAVGDGFVHCWATALWGVSDDRVHRWRARRRQLGTLEDLAPGGAAVHGLLPSEIDEILAIAEQWGPIDGSHRKLAHRGSYESRVWVAPSTFRRVLAAHGLVLPQRERTPRRAKTPWPDWLVWEPNRIWIWDVTHFGAAKRCVFAIVDMVSRRWIATLVSPEETSTQVRVVFDAALISEGLHELLTDERLDLDVDDTNRPILLAVSDNGPAMTSHDTRAYMALMAIAQHHGRPHTPTDQAWIETFFGHIKGEWPHLNTIRDAGAARDRTCSDPRRVQRSTVARSHRLRHPRRRTQPPRRSNPTGPPPRPPTSPPTTAQPQPPNQHQQPRRDPMTWFITNPISAEESDTPHLHATSATGDSTTPSINGPSARSPQAQDAARSTTLDEPLEIYTTKPSEHSPTDSSATSTAAYTTATTTTNTPPGPTANNKKHNSLLDTYNPGVSSPPLAT